MTFEKGELTMISRHRRLGTVAICVSAFLLTTQVPATSRTGIPPTVQFVEAPGPGEFVHYSVPFAWQGADVDGSVLLYRYVADPPSFGDSLWVETSSTTQRLVFQTSSLDLPVPASGPITFSQPHTVVVKAVDDEGLESESVSRSFFTSTIAPVVNIYSPFPSAQGDVPIGTSVTVEWEGTDNDGVFIQSPVRYKMLLLGAGTDYPGGVDAAWANPDAFRDHYAPLFENWFSTSGDTTSAHFTNLLPGQRYLFCVVGFDETGAYSARFTRGGNMILMLTGVTPTKPVSWGRFKSRYR